MSFDPDDTMVDRSVLLEQLSKPLPGRKARRLRRVRFSIAEAATLAANPHAPWGDVDYAAVLVEGGLESP